MIASDRIGRSKREALIGIGAVALIAGCSSGDGSASGASGTAASATNATSRPVVASVLPAVAPVTGTAVTTAMAVAPATATATVTASAAVAGSLGDPKGSIEHQLGLLKAGKVDELKGCFTERQRGKITAEAVAEGQKAVAKLGLEDLVGGGISEDAAKKTARVKMKAGNPLTTLILTDGKWLADTIWFK